MAVDEARRHRGVKCAWNVNCRSAKLRKERIRISCLVRPLFLPFYNSPTALRDNLYTALILSLLSEMTSSPFLVPHQGKSGKYTQAFLNQNGPGDGRPTALQIVKDNGREGTMEDKVGSHFLLPHT